MSEGPSRQSFLVVDDYGTGGIWFIVRASSEHEIRRVLSTVVICPCGTRPEWMSEEKLAEIAARRTYDIDSLPSSGWMTDLREGRLNRLHPGDRGGSTALWKLVSGPASNSRH
jgi:hypothetical protein